jgi:5-methylcytosine-specific restriction endonuclease McrA
MIELIILLAILAYIINYFLPEPIEHGSSNNLTTKEFLEQEIKKRRPVSTVHRRQFEALIKGESFDHLDLRAFDNGNMFMSREEKLKYMQSNQWRTKVRQLKWRKVCEVCGSDEKLEAHHNTYARLGNENLEDLNLLCRNCHQEIHNILGYDRRTKYNISILINYNNL